jgi:hypothetical protein
VMTRAQTISGTVTSGGTPLSGIAVVATPDGFFPYFGFTDSNGDYLIAVAFGLDYEVFTAAFPTYIDESWDNHHGCGCDFDPVPSGSLGDAPVSNIDFDLLDAAVAVTFDVYTSFDDSVIGNDYADVTVHLYRRVAGVWVVVESSVTQAFGLALLFGPSGGDYRLRFSDGSRWLAIQDYEDNTSPGSIPLTDECFVDFPGASDGDYFEYNFTLDELTGAGRCGNPVGSSGGTTTKHGTARAAVAFTTPTPTPTPSPTHTQRPSQRTTDEPTPTPTARPEVVDEASGFPWWLVAIVIALLAILGFIVFMIRRR